MIEISEAVKNFIRSNPQKNIRLSFADGSFRDLTNKDIETRSFNYIESVESGDSISLGTLEVPFLEFKIKDIGNIKGKEIIAKMEFLRPFGQARLNELEEDIYALQNQIAETNDHDEKEVLYIRLGYAERRLAAYRSSLEEFDHEYFEDLDRYGFTFNLGSYIVDSCPLVSNATELKVRNCELYSSIIYNNLSFREDYAAYLNSPWWTNKVGIRVYMEDIENMFFYTPEMINEPAVMQTVQRSADGIELSAECFHTDTYGMSWDKKKTFIGHYFHYYHFAGNWPAYMAAADGFLNAVNAYCISNDITIPAEIKKYMIPCEYISIPETFSYKVIKSESGGGVTGYTEQTAYDGKKPKRAEKITRLSGAYGVTMQMCMTYAKTAAETTDSLYVFNTIGEINIPKTATLTIGGQEFSFDGTDYLDSIYMDHKTISEYMEESNKIYKIDLPRVIKTTKKGRKTARFDSGSEWQSWSDQSVRRKEYTVDATEIVQTSIRTIMQAYAELQGKKGRIDRNGQFELISLSQEADELREPDITDADISKCEVSENGIKQIGRIVLNYHDIEEEGDLSAAAIDLVENYNSNHHITYIVNGNWILEKTRITQDQAQQILEDMAVNMRDISYVPCKIDLSARPWIEAGDYIKVSYKGDIFHTFVMKQDFSGIQALRQKIECRENDGEMQGVAATNVTQVIMPTTTGGSGGESGDMQEIPHADAETFGIAKLYNEKGQNEDGTVTQKLFTDLIDAIEGPVVDMITNGVYDRAVNIPITYVVEFKSTGDYGNSHLILYLSLIYNESIINTVRIDLLELGEEYIYYNIYITRSGHHILIFSIEEHLDWVEYVYNNGVLEVNRTGEFNLVPGMDTSLPTTNKHNIVLSPPHLQENAFKVTMSGGKVNITGKSGTEFINYSLNKNLKQKLDEIDAAIGLGDGLASNSVNYDNSVSGLEATNVKNAIDELKSLIDIGGGGSGSSDGIHEYKTTQSIYGKWIDGRIIYEITVPAGHEISGLTKYNTTDASKAFASSTYQNFTPDKSFDNQETTFWVAQGNILASIGYVFDSETTVSKIRIYPCPRNGGSYAIFDNIVIYGRDSDADEWTEIEATRRCDVATNKELPSSGYADYLISAMFKQYKLEGRSSVGGTYTGCGTIEFYHSNVDILSRENVFSNQYCVYHYMMRN